MIRFFKQPGLSARDTNGIRSQIANLNLGCSLVDVECCFCLETKEGQSVSVEELNKIQWLLQDTLQSDDHKFSEVSLLQENQSDHIMVEVGPRLSFATSWSSNAASIFESAGITNIDRVEQFFRYCIKVDSSMPLDEPGLIRIHSILHDRMTQEVYHTPLTTFRVGTEREAVQTIPLLEEGRKALEKSSELLGLGFDAWDIDFYSGLFEKMGRDPTDVELFDLANSNSEHSRHWFFGAKLVDEDGNSLSDTSLFKMVKSTLDKKNSNSVLAFEDNSSAIQGFEVSYLRPNMDNSKPSQLKSDLLHAVFTCETHNFPCGISPFPGASTGTGGRIRDNQATGRGAFVVAGTAGYCVGNIRQNNSDEYPAEMANPLQILLEASDGASDYGNKFGEPLILGHTRAFKGVIDGERREWIKPIMLSGGIGLMSDRDVVKQQPKIGQAVVKIGGPAFRIGLGGGAASSAPATAGGSDTKALSLNFDAVQRGDAEMENKMNRVISTCLHLDENPITSIHDQGAGGNGNVLKEIMHPLGGTLQLQNLPIGDKTMSSRELWVAEYQENNALLLEKENVELFTSICKRERCPMGVVGEVTGSGRVEVLDGETKVVDLDMDDVLGDMPTKTFVFTKSLPQPRTFTPLNFTDEEKNIRKMITKVFRLPSVGSKRFLVNKVDRSVSGLIAQQQAVGPIAMPVADYALISQSHFPSKDMTFSGVASSVGEQPLKGFYSPEAQGRLSAVEAITNIAFVKITALNDVKVSANWMWPAKQPGEGIKLLGACEGLCDWLKSVGVSIDGGKDSLSMAAVHNGKVVKSPGQIVVSAYAMCPDISMKVTPDVKRSGSDSLYFIDLSKKVDVSTSGFFGSTANLAGSSLLDALNMLDKVSDEACPDVCDADYFKEAFDLIQACLEKKLIVAGHDVSDGGLFTTLSEMVLAGGFDFGAKMSFTSISHMFGEAPGLVVQPCGDNEERFISLAKDHGVRVERCASLDKTGVVVVNDGNGECLLEIETKKLRAEWEATNFWLESHQVDATCAEAEKSVLEQVDTFYQFSATFQTPEIVNHSSRTFSVAIIREEGSNGDREMCAAFYAAGFNVHDVTMSDIAQLDTLDAYRGVAFVGGFSFGDVLGSAKGWASAIKFNQKISSLFKQFFQRTDTFSLGVCNGCQLVTLLGLVPGVNEESTEPEVRFVHNDSGRFESRFSQIRIEDSKSIMFEGMSGSELGVWVAHGEGKFVLNSGATELPENLSNLVALRYSQPGQSKASYPFNPNGSLDDVAGLCSPCGRHLALMPHPERCFRKYQWPYWPENWSQESSEPNAPWMKMFTNAYQWCAKIN